MPMRQILSLLLLILSANICSAEIHQWRDADGNLHFSDKAPTNVQSQQVEVQPNVYTAQNNIGVPTSDVTTSNPAVTLYSTTWCGYCRKARAYFQSKSIAFREYDVEKTAKGKRDYARFGAQGVPVILVGNQRLQGFSTNSFDRAYAQK